MARYKAIDTGSGKRGGNPSPAGCWHPGKQNAAVDQFRSMKKQNGADQTCAIFLPEIGVKKGFSTTSTNDERALLDRLRPYAQNGTFCIS